MASPKRAQRGRPEVWALPPFSPISRRLQALQEPSVGRPRLTGTKGLQAETFALTDAVFAVLGGVFFEGLGTIAGARAATRSVSSATIARWYSVPAARVFDCASLSFAFSSATSFCPLRYKARAAAVRAVAAAEAIVNKMPAKKGRTKKGRKIG